MKTVMPLPEKSGALKSAARIGPYRVLEQIGEGGMGRVFLAERADGEYEQHVALKLVHKSEEDEELLPRFQQERQALALLEHPNIAHLKDGGVTEEGQPYLVMEYIEGAPLDVYCERNRCDIQTRVRLFRKVLAGVQHAHQHFLVHRDLKPSNILVTQEGVPKLLDFGIAKWLQAAGGARKLITTRIQPMTPEYASPEQVKNAPVTTASDVYALGVLLYELLTGHLPYRKSAAQAYDLQKAICEEEIEKPSAALNRMEVVRASEQHTAKILTPETVSATREGSPQKLRRRLAGDLDSIVLKALRKEPQHRYSSVEQFSEDLQRYLEGRPVRAREGKLSYRAGKFVKRNAGKLSAAMAFAALLIGFAVNTSVQAHRIEQERDKAQEVSKFLADIFTLSDPNVARGDTITASALLKIGTARIDSLADQPEVQAELKDLMGNIYRKLGNYEVAEPLLRSALVYRVREYGEVHRAVADTKSNLGALLQEQANYEEAVRFQREAMMTYRRVLGYDSHDNGYSTGNLALTLQYMGEFAAAESLFHESIAILRQLFPEGNQDLAGGLNNLALIKMKHKDFAEAEALFREAHAMIKKVLPPRHILFAFAMGNIGHARMAQGDSVAADSLLREGIMISQEVFPEGHWVTARLKCRLGTCLIKLRRFPEAELHLSEAYRYQKTVQSDEHPYTQETFKILVMLYEAWGKPRQAEEYRRLLSPPQTASN